MPNKRNKRRKAAEPISKAAGLAADLLDASAKPAEREALAILKARLWANKIKSRAQVKPRGNRLQYHQPEIDLETGKAKRRKRLIRRPEAPGRFDWVWPDSRADQRSIAADLEKLFGELVKIPSQAVIPKPQPILLPEAIARREKAKKSLARSRKKLAERLAELDRMIVSDIWGQQQKIRFYSKPPEMAVFSCADLNRKIQNILKSKNLETFWGL